MYPFSDGSWRHLPSPNGHLVTLAGVVSILLLWGTTDARADLRCYIYTCMGLSAALRERHRRQFHGIRAKNGAESTLLGSFTAVNSRPGGMPARWMHRAVLLALCLLLVAAGGGGAKRMECEPMGGEGDPTAIDTSVLPDYWDATSAVRRQLASRECALLLTALTLRWRNGRTRAARGRSTRGSRPTRRTSHQTSSSRSRTGGTDTPCSRPCAPSRSCSPSSCSSSCARSRSGRAGGRRSRGSLH